MSINTLIAQFRKKKREESTKEAVKPSSSREVERQ